MYINISDSKEASNKGSSGALVHYLEKENRTELMDSPERWFNEKGKQFEAYDVRNAIDGNNSRLRNDEAKFFLINISPSQKELGFLLEKYGEAKTEELLKAYAEKVMSAYARNFKKDGVSSNADLLWFGKLEHHRYYTHRDKQVKKGIKKRGELKAGNQLHLQVIVSRKDRTGRMRLSPMNASKGRNAAHSKKMGQFDRVAFKQSGEVIFDNAFGFERNLADTMAYANINKNGSLPQREQLDLLVQGSAVNYRSKALSKELINEVGKGQFPSSHELLSHMGKSAADFLSILLDPAHDVSQANGLGMPAKKKKKKKGRSIQQSYGIGR